MSKKLNKIMLIDDSEADNFLHKRVITKADVCEEVVVTYSAPEALEYLKTAVNGEYACPEIVFLDINMPGMNGWDFLKEYEKLPKKMQAQMIVCMLTTSEAQEDRDKAKEFGIVKEFSTKPLTQEMLLKIVAEFYES
ncbi:response regulator [Portibacter marinus]|uniref:response regulator n=1 Tax=Portibacter marinus TaxID=2898660 RepID=UPI001F3C41AD|nr:response regulator [Portibacter marinus]